MKWDEIKFKLFEFESDQLGLYNPADDKVEMSTGEPNSRKPKFTLRLLNRLKKTRATDSIDRAKNLKLAGIMYAHNDDDQGIS